MRYKMSVRDGAAWNTPELSTRKPQVSMLDKFVHSTRLILSVEWPEGMMRVSLCMCFHAIDDDRDHGRIVLYLDASLVPLHEIRCCHRLIAQLSEEDLIARVCTGEGGHKFCRLWSLGLHDERYFGCKSHDASLCGLKHLSQPRTNSDPIRLTQSI